MPVVTEIAPDVYRIRFIQTPHVPHCWDAGLMFEETTGTLNGILT